MRTQRVNNIFGLSVGLFCFLGWSSAACSRPADSPIEPAKSAKRVARRHPENQDIKNLGVVVVRGERNRGLRVTTNAASADTISKAQIDATPSYGAGRVLDVVPGLIVTQHSGQAKANQYFLRGFNLDHGTDLSLHVAGMPVNERTHAHGQGYADLHFMIPELIGGLRYKKGPYYADEGDFSAAGAIHIDYVDTLPKGIASLGIGQYGFERGLVANSSGIGNGNLLYALEAYHNDGPWTHPDNYRKYNGVLRYSQGDADQGFNVTAMGYTGKADATNQIPRRAIAEKRIGLYGTLDPSDAAHSYRYSLSAGFHRASATSLTRANLYVIKQNLDLYSDFTYFLNDPVHGDQIYQSDHRVTSGATLEQTWFGTLAGFEFDNTVGVDLRSDNIYLGLFHTDDRHVLSSTRIDHVLEQSLGIYYQNTIDWTDKFRSIAGVRADFYAADDTSKNFNTAGVASDHLISPKLSLVFGPWAKTRYYANFGFGFHSNDARGAATNINPVNGEPQGNTPLLVRARGYEIGLRTYIVPDLKSSLALYRLDFDSELVFAGDSGTTESSGPSNRTGIEWINTYTPTAWLTFNANLTYARARFANGNHIPEAVEGVGSLSLRLHDLGPYYGSVEVEYFGPRALTEDNSVRSGSTTEVNAQVGYRFTDNFHVQLNGFNLFNSRDAQISYYYRSRLQGERRAGFNDIEFHPLESRSLRLSAVYSF